MVYRGLIPRRDDEIWFVLTAALNNGSHFERAQRNAEVSLDDVEIAFELTYAVTLRPEAFSILTYSTL